MKNFSYHNYTNIVFGKDTEQKAGALTAELGQKVLLHYGGGSVKQSGLLGRVKASLDAAGMAYVELGGVKPNPCLGPVKEAIELCRREGVDCILAVGGGSVIDSAKAIAAGVPYAGDVWDFFSGKAKLERDALPLGVVLTIPAAGSESSFNMVITKEEGLLKRGAAGAYLRPRFAILNPELTYSLPFYQTACGVSDILAHIMERYFTHTENVDVSDRLCEALMRSVINTAPRLKENSADYAARAEIMWAGTLAHNGLLGLGREEDWGSHGIEHELSAIYDIAHGAGLSIIFPAWIKYVNHLNPARFMQWAVRVWDVDLAFGDGQAVIDEGVRRLEEFYRRMELPVRLSEIGIDDARFGEMAQKCAPRGVFMRMNAGDIENIYRLAL